MACPKSCPRTLTMTQPKPPHSRFWGHLKLVGETIALFPENSQYQIWCTTLAQRYNLPGLFYLDLWPLGPTQVVVIDPNLADHFVSPNMYPKHAMEKLALDRKLTRLPKVRNLYDYSNSYSRRRRGRHDFFQWPALEIHPQDRCAGFLGHECPRPDTHDRGASYDIPLRRRQTCRVR